MIVGAEIGIFLFLIGVILYRHHKQLSSAQYATYCQKFKSDFMTTIVERSRDGIIIQDLNARILWANSAWLNHFGYSLEEVLGRNPLSLVIPERDRMSPEEIDAFKYDMNSGFLGRYELVRNCRRDGSEVWTQLSFTHHKLGSEDKIVVFCRDVTEEVSRSEELERTNKLIAFRADHDILTSAANRDKLGRFYEKTRADAERSGRRFALLHIDLDRFKHINDNFGHAAGDQVIKMAAERMQSLLSGADLLARIGGDEFVIVIADAPDFAPVLQLAESIIHALSAPIEWDDKSLHIGASIGIALSTDSASDQSTLMHHSDLALYEAKRLGRGRAVCYDKKMDQSQMGRAVLSRELAAALELGQLEVHFQPQYSLIAKGLTGFEALIRWRHPTRGLLRPSAFLDVAAETGLIDKIDRFAATEALEALQRLSQFGHKGLHISLNASPRSMASLDFADFLEWEADRFGIEPDRITVEVLESTVFSQHGGNTERTTRALSRRGFRVELDDFGTGHAGLSHLGRLRVDGVKIDKEMIHGILDDVTNQIIVQAIIALGTDLGLRVLAEGVTDSEVTNLLRGFGCTNVQGAGIADAMPYEQIDPWIRSTDFRAIFAAPKEPLVSDRARAS